MNTYALLVQCFKINMLHIMTFILSLKTNSIDFSKDFAQAKLKVPPVYMHFIPRDNLGHDMVLSFKKIIYVQAEAPRLWFEKLAKGI